jgi:hypothetical protein
VDTGVFPPGEKRPSFSFNHSAPSNAETRNYRRDMPLFLRIVNQLDALSSSNIFICLSPSTCFGHYVPIIRRDPIAPTQILYLSFCERSLVSIRILYKLNSDIIIIMCYIYI